MRQLVVGCLLFAAVIEVSVRAEIAPMPPERLRTDATDIVVGTVNGIFTEETRDANWYRTSGVVEIAVETVDKGNKLAPGDSVYARFWTQHWIGKGNPPPSWSGHRLPGEGDEIRAYHQRNDGGYEAMLPNGLQTLTPAQARKPKR